MLPFILAGLGVYLIGDAMKDGQIFADGGMMADGGEIKKGDIVELKNGMQGEVIKFSGAFGKDRYNWVVVKTLNQYGGDTLTIPKYHLKKIKDRSKMAKGGRTSDCGCQKMENGGKVKRKCKMRYDDGGKITELEIEFDENDPRVIGVEYSLKKDGKEYEISGTLRPYHTGRDTQYEFEPGYFYDEETED